MSLCCDSSWAIGIFLVAPEDADQGVIQRIGGNDAEGQQAAAEQARQAGAAQAPTAWQLKATGAVVY